MLRQTKRGGWLTLAAAALFVVFWSFALTGNIPSSVLPPKPQAIERPTQQPEKESAQDIAAETVAYYTKVLAWFTGLLVIVAAFQLRILWRSDKTARSMAEIAGRQVAILGSQTDIIAKQHGLARLQYAVLHGACLTVRAITLSNFSVDSRPVVELSLVNTGKTDAEITGISGDIGWRRRGEWMVPCAFAVPGNHPDKTVMKAGERTPYRLEGNTVVSRDIFQTTYNTIYEMCVSGEVTYVDKVTGLTHRTGFFRIYDPVSRSFRHSGAGEDFSAEYEE